MISCTFVSHAMNSRAHAVIHSMIFLFTYYYFSYLFQLKEICCYNLLLSKPQVNLHFFFQNHRTKKLSTTL